MDGSRTLVLFAGAWGNQSDALVRWWFRHVISFFKGWNVVVVTYKGQSLNHYVNTALIQLENVPNDAYAFCYSMGSQVARGVAAKRPRLFKRVVLVSGLERFGVRFRVFLTSLTFALWPILRVLMGKPLKLDSIAQVKRVFLTATKGVEADLLATEILESHSLPEQAWPTIQLFLPPMRQWMPPFACPVMAIVPEKDFFIRSASYPGEKIQVHRVSGDHSLLVGSYSRLLLHLQRIELWLTH